MSKIVTGWVYFVQTTCGTLVKIGYSVNPIQRMNDIRFTARAFFRAEDVVLLGVIFSENAKELESQMHNRFASYRSRMWRSRKEWFELRGELRSFLSERGFFPTDSKCPRCRAKLTDAELVALVKKRGGAELLFPEFLRGIKIATKRRP